MDWMKMLDDDKPDWMSLTAWWSRQFYLIADTNVNPMFLDRAMRTIRPAKRYS